MIGLAAPVQGQQTFRLGDDDTWRAESAPDPGTPEGSLENARRTLADERYERAEFLASEWIERNPNHPAIPDAYLVRGDALRGQEEFYQSLFDYEHIARNYPGSDAFVTALEREYEIASIFAGGLKRKMWGMRIVRADDEVEKILLLIQERLPGSRLAEQAGLTLADFYFSRRQMDLAVEMYSLFIELYPRSEYVNKAERRLIYAHLASFKGPAFDAKGLDDAKTRLVAMKATEPYDAQAIGADALLTRIDESQAVKLLETARWYARTNDPVAADLTLRRLVRDYPSSAAAREGHLEIEGIASLLPEVWRQRITTPESQMSPPDASPEVAP